MLTANRIYIGRRAHVISYSNCKKTCSGLMYAHRMTTTFDKVVVNGPMSA